MAIRQARLERLALMLRPRRMVKDPTAASKEQRIDFSAVFYAASQHPEGKGGFAGSELNGLTPMARSPAGRLYVGL